MLSHPLQYSPQGLNSQFPGAQAGFAQMSPFSFAQPGGYNGNAQFGHEPFAPNPFFAGPLAGQAGMNIPAHQIVPVLGQLAQQIAVQSAVAQQIGIAVQQLVQHLAAQGIQGQGFQGFPVGGFGAGQLLAGAGQPYPGQLHPGQPYPGGGAQAFGLGGQGPYGGFSPQAQAWGSHPQAWGPNRSQTIQ